MFNKNKSDQPSTQTSATSTTNPSTKGKPTPSRKDAQAARKARLKGETKALGNSRADRQARVAQRDRMLAGDESALMARDRGPSRRFARNFVDARRNAGELFLPGALLILILGFFPSVALKSISLWIWFAMVLVIAVDSVFMVRSLKRALAAKHDESADLSGLSFYATMRALQIRRLRAPKCQLKPGDTP
ncbi:MAG: DUF3043 domain-containing protein [Actinomycetes bacterium]|jgi:hypothetical protein